ncbi:hypothetical protein DFH09DRAFT_1068704 [Mycena vulgaris]|nr:hypothetical protein DFH09DRAFT_1068704 [Mycena vulgaris]
MAAIIGVIDPVLLGMGNEAATNGAITPITASASEASTSHVASTTSPQTTRNPASNPRPTHSSSGRISESRDQYEERLVLVSPGYVTSLRLNHSISIIRSCSAGSNSYH